jgi:hypothetical protein
MNGVEMLNEASLRSKAVKQIGTATRDVTEASPEVEPPEHALIPLAGKALNP